MNRALRISFCILMFGCLGQPVYAIENVESLFVQGDQQFDKGAYDAAAVFYKQALDLDPAQPQSYSDICLTYAMQEDFAQELDFFQKAMDLGPNVADYYYNFGFVLGKMNRLQEAQRYFKQTIVLNKNFSEAYYNLGVIAYLTKDYETAIKNFDQYIQKFSFWAKDFERVMGCFSCENNPIFCDYDRWINEEIHACLKAVEENPEDARAFCSLGVAYGTTGNLPKAAEAFEKSIALEPNYAKAHYNLANVYVKMKKLPEADQLCRRAVELDFFYDDGCRFLSFLAKDKISDVPLEPEISCCQKAISIQLDPLFYKAYYFLGLSYYHLGNFKNARAQIRKLSPQHLDELADELN